jgi:hypothetical protein
VSFRLEKDSGGGTSDESHEIDDNEGPDSGDTAAVLTLESPSIELHEADLV